MSSMNLLEFNQGALNRSLGYVRSLLERQPPGEEPSPPPQLEALSATFSLSPFEQNILLLCAAIELDSSFGALCASAQGDPARPYPTFSLALAALPEPHWSALNPAAPLRHWKLIDVSNQGGVALTASRLRIDEQILHYLTGIHYLDERLMGLMHAVRHVPDQVPSHQQIAATIASTWTRPGRAPVIFQLCGADEATKRSIAAGGCAFAGLSLYAFAADQIPANAQEMAGLIRMWEREAALTSSALYIDADAIDRADTRAVAQVSRFLEQIHGPTFLGVRDRWRPLQRIVKTLDIPKPTVEEQTSIWHSLLSETSAGINGHAADMAAQFSLPAHAIHASVAEAIESGQAGDDLAAALWDAGRAQARPRLDDLAQRIEAAATWDDLVLPIKEKALLKTIGAHVKHRAKVYGDWGFGAVGKRGLGISALFAGASGTGKTMAAEVLANDLHLDLYRIDLSSVVSKYIGETEKNLRRVFDAAEDGGAILFFDEADALFGKRSEVNDSHDRYANIEINYLLQRMESYRGLAVLATNMRSALDSAFLRRIRFVVNFPFPETAQRAEIWQRVFPKATPVNGLDVDRLARLSIAGGNIRNIALNAAFLAAKEGTPVGMGHLAHAARNEFAKIEKPLPESDLGGWV